MPDSPKPIDDAWNHFARVVIPNDAKEVQRAEMRKSFFAGAYALFTILMKETDDGEDEPTESNIQLMRHAEANLMEFVKDLGESKAH